MIINSFKCLDQTPSTAEVFTPAPVILVAPVIPVADKKSLWTSVKEKSINSTNKTIETFISLCDKIKQSPIKYLAAVFAIFLIDSLSYQKFHRLSRGKEAQINKVRKMLIALLDTLTMTSLIFVALVVLISLFKISDLIFNYISTNYRNKVVSYVKSNSIMKIILYIVTLAIAGISVGLSYKLTTPYSGGAVEKCSLPYFGYRIVNTIIPEKYRQSCMETLELMDLHRHLHTENPLEQPKKPVQIGTDANH